MYCILYNLFIDEGLIDCKPGFYEEACSFPRLKMNKVDESDCSSAWILVQRYCLFTNLRLLFIFGTQHYSFTTMFGVHDFGASSATFAVSIDLPVGHFVMIIYFAMH